MGFINSRPSSASRALGSALTSHVRRWPRRDLVRRRWHGPPFRCRGTPRSEHRHRRSFQLWQAQLLPDAGLSGSPAGEAQAAKIGSRIAYIRAVFPAAKQRLVLGFRRAAGRRRRNRRQLGPFLSAIEDRDRFPAVDGAKHVLHVVAKIDCGRVQGVSLYRYTFSKTPVRRFTNLVDAMWLPSLLEQTKT